MKKYILLLPVILFAGCSLPGFFFDTDATEKRCVSGVFIDHTGTALPNHSVEIFAVDFGEFLTVNKGETDAAGRFEMCFSKTNAQYGVSFNHGYIKFDEGELLRSTGLADEEVGRKVVYFKEDDFDDFRFEIEDSLSIIAKPSKLLVTVNSSVEFNTFKIEYTGDPNRSIIEDDFNDFSDVGPISFIKQGESTFWLSQGSHITFKYTDPITQEIKVFDIELTDTDHSLTIDI